MDNQYTEPSSEQESSVNESNLAAPGEIIIGELLGFNSSGEPQVIYPGSSGKSLSAMSTVAITHEHKGRQLALLFANGDVSKPVIMGLIYSPLLDLMSNIEVIAESDTSQKDTLKQQVPQEKDTLPENEVANNSGQATSDTAYIDGNRVVLEGKEEIVLKCGDASITLTKAGKILIRGKYLLNRSSGVNRIMGGSVQVN